MGWASGVTGSWSSPTLNESSLWTLKVMDFDALNAMHNSLRRQLGYDSTKQIDYDQLDPNLVAMYNAVDSELCSRRQALADPGKIAMMFAEELLRSNGAVQAHSMPAASDGTDAGEGGEGGDGGDGGAGGGD